jgi:hypothetical protein
MVVVVGPADCRDRDPASSACCSSAWGLTRSPTAAASAGLAVDLDLGATVPSRPDWSRSRSTANLDRGYSLLVSGDVAPVHFDAGNGAGVLFARDKSDLSTHVSLEVKDQPTEITAADLPVLEKGFLAGLRRAPKSRIIQPHVLRLSGFLVGLEAYQTFEEEGQAPQALDPASLPGPAPGAPGRAGLDDRRVRALAGTLQADHDDLQLRRSLADALSSGRRGLHEDIVHLLGGEDRRLSVEVTGRGAVRVGAEEGRRASTHIGIAWGSAR